MEVGNPSWSSSGHHIPFDIIADEILPRLPAKSLLKFTSVCKEWLCCIKSLQFIQAHLHHNRFEAKNKLKYPLIYNRKSLYKFDLQNQKKKAIRFSKIVSPTKIALNIESCNGLVLLHLRSKIRQRVYLWNPSIRKIKLIFSGVLCFMKPHDYEVFGLGFQESSKQHRVVKIKYVKRMITKVEVYNCSLDSWHSVDSSKPRDQTITITSHRGGVYLNGCIHWIASSVVDGVFSLTLFDFENEVFREIDLPEQVNNKDTYMAKVKEFKGSLAVVYFDNDNDNDNYHVWNMNYMTEYGVFKSWTKKLSVTLDDVTLDEDRGGYSRNVPESFTKNGKLVYQEDVNGIRHLNFKDVQNHQVDFIKGFKGRISVIDYMETLTLL